MKRYIKTDFDNKLKYKIIVVFNLQIDSADYDVAASRQYGFDPKILPEKLWNKMVAKYDSFVDSVRMLLASRGFHEIEAPSKSSYSDSEYFLFCLEDDYAVCEVELCCMLRLTGHPLKERFKGVLPEDVQEKWANTYKSDSLLKYNTKAQDQKFEYEYYKYDAEQSGKDYTKLPPKGVTISVAGIVINGLKYMSAAQALTEIDLELDDIKSDIIKRSKILKLQRDKYSADPNS